MKVIAKNDTGVVAELSNHEINYLIALEKSINSRVYKDDRNGLYVDNWRTIGYEADLSNVLYLMTNFIKMTQSYREFTIAVEMVKSQEQPKT